MYCNIVYCTVLNVLNIAVSACIIKRFKLIEIS